VGKSSFCFLDLLTQTVSITHMPSSTTIKAKQTAERDDLEVLYQMVRIIRKSKDIYASLDPIFHRKDHPNDWLLTVEIAELLQDRNDSTLKKF
jgi:phenylalanine-4-hydroxylase